MNHRCCCVLCRKEVSAQGLNGHRLWHRRSIAGPPPEPKPPGDTWLDQFMANAPRLFNP